MFSCEWKRFTLQTLSNTDYRDNIIQSHKEDSVCLGWPRIAHCRLTTFMLLLNRSNVHSFACDGIWSVYKQSRNILFIYHFYFLLLTAKESLLSQMHGRAQYTLSNLCTGICLLSIICISEEFRTFLIQSKWQ